MTQGVYPEAPPFLPPSCSLIQRPGPAPTPGKTRGRHLRSQGFSHTWTISPSPYCSHKALHDPPCLPLPSSPPHFPLAHYASAIWGASTSLTHTRHAPASGPLHSQVPPAPDSHVAGSSFFRLKHHLLRKTFPDHSPLYLK